MGMRIGLHDADLEYLKGKSFPNYALMKISAFHKERGDDVEWWMPILKKNYEKNPERIIGCLESMIHSEFFLF